MKKIIISILAILLATVSMSAQGFVDFRLEGGASFNFGSIMLNKEKLNTKNMTGYHLGAFADFKVAGGFFVGSGLKFSMKGNATEGTAGLGASKTIFHYIELPINVGYKLNLSRSVALALQTGPYFSFAMAGTRQNGTSLANLGKSYSIFKEGLARIGDDFKAKRFDIGWGLATRLYYSHYYATFGMDFGFLNVLNNTSKDTTIGSIKDNLLSLNNKQCYIGLGICF